MTESDDARWARRLLAGLDPVADTGTPLDGLVGEVRDDVRSRRDGEAGSHEAGGSAHGVPPTVADRREDGTAPSRTGDGARHARDAVARRRARWVAAAALVTVMAAVGAATTLGGSDDGAVTAGPPASGVDEVKPPAQAEVSPIWTVAESGGVELRVETPGPVTVGTRTPVAFTIRNTRQVPIYWQAGGCAVPVEATFGPAGDRTAVEGPDEGGWDGAPGTLPDWVREHNALVLPGPHQPTEATGGRDQICTLVGRVEAIEAGAELHHRGSFEVRVPPGPLSGGGAFDATTTFTWYDQPGDYGSQVPGSTVSVKVSVPVLDDPGRGGGSADQALAAMAADPRLDAWLTSTRLGARADPVGSYQVELSWWRDGWELWLTPQFFDGGVPPLRMRFDPSTGTVTDARTVIIGLAPADEPGAVRPSQAAPDEVFELPASTTTTTTTTVVEGEVVGSGGITDVRLARQGDVDRLVIEFARSVPAHDVGYGELGQTVGECVAPSSDAAEILVVALRGTTFEDSSTPPYEGSPLPMRGDTQYAEELIVGCDFELTVHLVLGMVSAVPFRVEELDNPPRLVIDMGPDLDAG